MTPSRSRMTSFMTPHASRSSSSQLRNIRDAVHLPPQVGEQREPALAHFRIVYHDHDLVEERVDRGLEDGEGPEITGVIAAVVERRRLLRRVEQRFEQVALRRFPQFLEPDTRERFSLRRRLPEYV